MGDWQRIVYEKSERLCRLHAAIVALEARAEPLIDVWFSEAVGAPLVSIQRSRLLTILKEQESDITKDLARILRHVSE
jgi:hypothetical protein